MRERLLQLGNGGMKNKRRIGMTGNSENKGGGGGGGGGG